MMKISNDSEDRMKKVISEEMKRFRKEHNMTQEKMAACLEISLREYGNLERGVHFPSAVTLALFMTQMDTEEFQSLLKKLEEADNTRE